jgi:hypothetical protein
MVRSAILARHASRVLCSPPVMVLSLQLRHAVEAATRAKLG